MGTFLAQEDRGMLTEVASSVRLVEFSRDIAFSCCNKPHNACNPDFLHGGWTAAAEYMMW